MSEEITTVPESLTTIARTQYATATRKSVEFVRQLALFGETLKQVKEIVDHGMFLDWIEENFELSERTARVYMQLFDHIKEIEGATSVREALRMIEDANPKRQHAATLPEPTPTRTTRPKEVIVDVEVVKAETTTSWTATKAEKQPDEMCEVGWLLLTSERDMIKSALTPGNSEWQGDAITFVSWLRDRKIVSV
jgi:hypothetical protein